MIRAALVSGIFILVASAGWACPKAGNGLLFHSCWGKAQVELLLLPEDLPLPAPSQARENLIVTGTYTGRDSRNNGLHNPVGLFIHQGKTINPTLARMDGIALISRDKRNLNIMARRAVELENQRFDLSDLGQRQNFIATARKAGVSVMQSHLLIVDGRVDTNPVKDAPLAVRRILFSDADGYGIWQTPRPMTLHNAAIMLEHSHAPRMALNLDMGSYDYCRLWQDKAPSQKCGSLGDQQIGILSNLLRFWVE